MKTHTEAVNKKRSRSGSILSAAIVGASAALLLFSAMSLCLLLNHRNHPQASQDSNARGIFSRDMQSATSIARATDTQLVLNTIDGVPIVYSFDVQSHTLSRIKGHETTKLLTGVESASFSLYEPKPDCKELAPATIKNARGVGLKWLSLCSNSVGLEMQVVAFL